MRLSELPLPVEELAPDTPDTKPHIGRTGKKRWATKVKTGCLTCKVRRVKCDERRPHCRRCATAGRMCEGYEANCINATPTKAVENSTSLAWVPISPPTTPQLVGSTDIRDLLYLMPKIASSLRSPSTSKMNNWGEVLPSRIKELGSYVFYLPSRSGYDAALDGAVRCVATALRDVISSGGGYSLDSNSNQNRIAQMYGQVLSHLQQGLSDPDRSLSAEVLCTAHLLCHFEALQPSSTKALIQHADGASRLILHRGPERFTTEFEKSLLTHHISTITSKGWISNTKSFLDNDDWKAAIRSAIIPDTTCRDRSAVRLLFYSYAVPIYTLMVDCSALIMGEVEPKDRESQHLALLARLEQQVINLEHWRRQMFDLEPKIESEIYNNANDWGAAHSDWADSIEVLQTAVMTHGRLYVALDGSRRLQVERQTQGMAAELIKSHKKRLETKVRQINTIVIIPICNAILSTAPDWAAFCEPPPADCKLIEPGVPRLISREIFWKWANLSGSCVSWPSEPPS